MKPANYLNTTQALRTEAKNSSTFLNLRAHTPGVIRNMYKEVDQCVWLVSLTIYTSYLVVSQLMHTYNTWIAALNTVTSQMTKLVMKG